MSVLTAPTIPQIALQLAISDETAYRIFRRGVVAGARQHPVTGRWQLPADAVAQIRAAYQIDQDSDDQDSD